MVDMRDKDLKLIYLAGLGRSGGTLLGRVLGEIPRVFYAGEMYFLWADGLVEDRLCQCGQPFSTCPFWKEVVASAFPGKEFGILGKEMSFLQKRVVREKNFFRMMFPALQGAAFRREMHRYYAATRSLYQHALRASGAEFLVDSSRHVVNLLGLAQSSDLYVIHLVRDVRGVVYSYRKLKYNPARQQYLPNLSWGRVLRDWVLKNTMVEAICRLKSIPYFRVGYEEFVEYPSETLKRIAEFLGLPENVDVMLSERRVVLRQGHAVGGNPDKFVQGEVPLIPDVAWKKSLPACQRALIGVMAAPWLSHYGYLRLGREKDAQA